MGERPSPTAAAWLLVVLVIGLSSLGLAHAGPPSNASADPSGPVTVASQPAANGFTASPNPDDVGVSASFDASGACLAVVGTCNYSYSGLPPGCSGSSGSSFECAPSSAGQFNVNATATWACPICATNTASLTFDVNDYPSLTAVTATPAALDIGQSTRLSASVGGGTSPISYTWSQLPSGCSSPRRCSSRLRCAISGARSPSSPRSPAANPPTRKRTRDSPRGASRRTPSLSRARRPRPGRSQ